MKFGTLSFWRIGFVLGAATLSASAQWLTQTVTVTNGWTAAYLFVDASSQPILPTAANLPLSPGNPIDQIWLWQVPASTAQYVTTPQSPLNAGGRWLSWNMTNSQNTLAALVPNSAYLIHSRGPGTYTWSIQGQPAPPHYIWDLTGLNFIGLSTPPVNPPSFASFFAPDPAIVDIAQIYQYVGGPFSTQPPALNPSPVTFFSSTPVNRGQAFWVGASNVNNSYFGPFQVNLPNPAGLFYGPTAGQFTFHLVNLTSGTLTVSMSLLPSETPPYGQTPIVGSPPMLLEGALNATNLTYAYSPVKSSPTSWTLPPFGQPGSDIGVVLGVNRFAMTGPTGSLYAGILQFTDSLGLSQVNVPVSASVSDNAGLWVGKANVSQVSYDLKTYATDNSGSYVSTLTTNHVVTFVTNSAAAFSPVTNILVATAFLTNTVATNYTVTNQIINTYASNSISISSNGFVISTNLMVNAGYTTNTEITTTVTGYYFTNKGQLLVWQTANSTNVSVVADPSITNQVLVTNQIDLVPAAGALTAVTNFLFYTYTAQSYLVTNAIFSAPVTNFSASSFSITNSFIATNAAYNGLATNLITTFSMTTNDPVVTNYVAATNTVATGVATNSFAAPPLYVFTNPPSVITVSVITNTYSFTNAVSLFYATNSFVINQSYLVTGNSTNLTGTATNLVFAATAALPPQSTFSVYTNISLSFATNPWVVAVTNALVSSISNYVVSAHNTNLDAVVAPYPLRLIVFNDANGSCSLLQRVFYGLRQDTNLVVSTTESALDASHLDVARRITATHLPWAPTNVPWRFSGGALAQGGTYSTTIVEPYDDQASNPYLHTYHPDHNNLDVQSPPHELPMGSESYEIDRTITLSLSASTDDFISLTRANSALAGSYFETVSLKGLAGYAKTYRASGTFSLQRLSPISTLTTH
ncbi:MAG TPA: hypothetical protein VHB20_11570 [Verrucomicrobiae bacterium]|nr:hypothetical protein [Verrucomicrobiae bacterium]